MLVSQVGRANLGASMEMAGFMGTYALGFTYDWNDHHTTDLLIGTYSNGDRTYHQSDVIYRYSHWNVYWGERLWKPLQVGLFTIRSWDGEHYFLSSPKRYPYDDYYDETAFRWGVEFSSSVYLRPSSWALAYRLRVLDNGLVAIYNNANKDLQYYISSGLALQYWF